VRRRRPSTTPANRQLEAAGVSTERAALRASSERSRRPSTTPANRQLEAAGVSTERPARDPIPHWMILIRDSAEAQDRRGCIPQKRSSRRRV